MSSTPLTCCITLDFDAMSSWVGTMKSQNPSMISRGQFGAVAIPRILDLLARFEVPASFAIPGHTAYAFPKAVEAICAAGHEIVHHGWVHENPAEALSDSNTVLNIRYLENVLAQAKATHALRLELLNEWGEDRVHLDD